MENKSISTIIYVVAGVVLGYVSFMLNDHLISLAIAIAFLVVIAGVMKKLLKIDEGFKWFLSHGGWLYLFIWFITWVIFFNL